jgi:hypothetical protein
MLRFQSMSAYKLGAQLLHPRDDFAERADGFETFVSESKDASKGGVPCLESLKGSFEFTSPFEGFYDMND